MNRQPRLLYLGHNLPFPPHEGALIRSYHTVRLLSQAFDLSGIYFYRRSASPTEKERRRAQAQLQEFGSVSVFPIPQETSRIRLVWDHLRSVGTWNPYTRWAHESEASRRALQRHLDSSPPDLVHVDSLDLVAFLRVLPPLPTVLAHHNIESALLRRRAETEHGFVRSYLRFQAGLVEQAERHWCPRVALNVVVSDADEAALQRLAPGIKTLVLPNGVDTNLFRPQPTPSQGNVVFVGGYSWFPNADGMDYFASRILPTLREAIPQVSVKWIGKAPEAAKRRFEGMGVKMLGYVDDIVPEMGLADCVIVPLRVGGGTRLKILDAWALGKAVVSTSVGCEGLRTEPGGNLLINDDPKGFAEDVARVLKDPDLRRRLENGGRDTAVSHYDWELLGRRMIGAYMDILEKHGATSSMGTTSE